MKLWFEEGRLPCGFSQEPIWDSILAKLKRFDSEMTTRKSTILEKQQRKKLISQEIQSALETIQKLAIKISQLEEEERSHAAAEETLQAELEAWQKLDVSILKSFVQSAADMENELVRQLEFQLARDREGLLSLREEGGPKLGLLLNCFGADEKSIRALKDLSSMDLLMITGDEFNMLMADIPRNQHIAVLYAQERLLHGKLPFADHDCALCDCESAEDMAAFLQENGMIVSADLIRQTGAFGRGSLLFLTTQELDLNSAQKSLLNKARADHRRGITRDQSDVSTPQDTDCHVHMTPAGRDHRMAILLSRADQRN